MNETHHIEYELLSVIKNYFILKFSQRKFKKKKEGSRNSSFQATFNNLCF